MELNFFPSPHDHGESRAAGADDRQGEAAECRMRGLLGIAPQTTRLAHSPSLRSAPVLSPREGRGEDMRILRRCAGRQTIRRMACFGCEPPPFLTIGHRRRRYDVRLGRCFRNGYIAIGGLCQPDNGQQGTGSAFDLGRRFRCRQGFIIRHEVFGLATYLMQYAGLPCGGDGCLFHTPSIGMACTSGDKTPCLRLRGAVIAAKARPCSVSPN